MITTKNTLRQQGIKAREKLSFSEITEKSKKINQFLMAMPEIKNSSEIFCYLSSDQKKEVSTSNFITWALVNNKNVYVPHSNWEKRTLSLHRLENFPPDMRFFELKHNILEPKKDYNLENDWSKLQVLILPGTAGDIHGTRYGLSAGFFDRFLEQISGNGGPMWSPKKNGQPHRTTPTTILILFQEQLFPELPREKHDFPVDIIVTDTKIYRI